MNPAQLAQSLKAEACQQGFDFVGIAPALDARGYSRFNNWLDDGFYGEMEYLQTRRIAYQHPRGVLPEARSVMMLAMSYHTDQASADCQPGRGRIARYAWGQVDYHDYIHKKLKLLCRSINGHLPDATVRGVVDTAPLLEREFAQLAGLGWHAKNTMLIHPKLGSWFLIAAVLLDVELEYDAPFEAAHCGTCTACIAACPTDAFVKPGVMDATRCISYLTIEHRSPIPVEFRPMMQDWILGCDICQNVCPWNNKAQTTSHEVFEPLPELTPLDLHGLFRLDDDGFRARFRKTPLWRPKRRGILRNAAIALGNNPSAKGLETLGLGIKDSEPLVRGAAAWAIDQHRLVPEFAVDSQSLLRDAVASESDPIVVDEIEQAIAAGDS